ncbi:MAG: PAS domain S-box protein [Proteobacteria bacterium]|nr:PAS domain S-box protein [Pseudomonadota bacterium]
MPELAREAFRAIADCTFDWESWIGPQGDTRWINPAVERMTGYAVAECLALADYPLALVHLDDRAALREALAGAARGSSGNDLEFRIQRRDGTVGWGAMSWQPLTGSEGRQLGYRTSVRDITERKRAEEGLRTALIRAERAERARAAFLAQVSHELRTPLHSLLGFTELLLGSPLAAAQREWAALMREQGAVLLQLLDQLLDAAAQDAGRAPQPWERFSLRALAERLVAAQRPRIEAAGVALVLEPCDDRLEIVSDRHAVLQIVSNLLDNARKFTRAGAITLSVARSVVPSEAISIAVRDTGCGMDPARVAELRRPFVRGAAPAGVAPEGAGLGLAIVDRLVAELGADLAIETALGCGSCFTLTLPVVAPAAADTAMAIRPAALGQPRVLVVDDSAASRALAQAFLIELGCAVETVSGGRAAVARCQAVDFDLVLMDRQLGELDGASAAALIRAQRPLRAAAPLLVAVTADVFGARAPALAVFDAVLTKPVSLETLARCLGRLLVGQVPPAAAADAAALEPVLDEARLAELQASRTAEGRSFWEAFGHGALAELARIAAALAAAPAGGDPAPEQGRLAHEAKGSAALLGASRLAATAAQAQAACETQPGPVATAAVGALLREIHALLALVAARGLGPPPG